MLKLNYTDFGLFLELVEASLDAVATQRVMLAVYTGEPLHLEPGRAAFLLPTHLPGVMRLQRILYRDATNAATLTTVDSDFVEVSLKGTWIASNAQAEAGTFIATLNPDSEALIYQLWQTTQRHMACYR